MTGDRWGIGVDLGGTKVEVAQVDEHGEMARRMRRPTEVAEGLEAIVNEIVSATEELEAQMSSPAVAIGVGVAGQIEADTGVVMFAPNLGWRSVPLGSILSRALNKPTAVTNDVRAAAWGEWLHGAGKGCDNLICLFVGTGIGGGVVSEGRMLAGCSNTAGELGHITVDLHGRVCHCGNQGCMEALAGGWAIAQSAEEAVDADPSAAAPLLELAGGKKESITAKLVAGAFHNGDPLARRVMEAAGDALVGGCVGLVNAFNPCRLIVGGGVMEGMPELVKRLAQEVPERALKAASEPLEVRLAKLENNAGVIGAATLAIRLTEKEKPL